MGTFQSDLRVMSAPRASGGSARRVILANSSKNRRRRSCRIAFIVGLSAGAERVIRSLTSVDTKRCSLSAPQAPIA